MSSATRNIFKSICGRTGRGVTGGAERSPWVTDIHNGIYNPNFTYTGGQAIVPDENGILRRTPAGYPAVEGGAWSGTNWLPPTAGTTRSISTRKGLRTIQTADTFKGMLIEPAMTNKVTARKSNPTDLTGAMKSGDAASVLSVVNDAAALTAAGLSDICTSGMVYKLDNSAGAGLANVYFSGVTINTNAHSVSIFIRSTGISLNSLGWSVTGGAEFGNPVASAGYIKYRGENVIPPSSTGLMFRVGAGNVAYCILPQLEESAFCTSIIAPAADTAAAQTRVASVNSAPTAGVFPSTGQDFGLYLECVATAAGQTATLLSTRVDADNLLSVSTTATAIGVNLRKTATDNAASAAYTHTADEKFQVIIVKSAMGISVKAREYSSGAWQAWGDWGNNETAGAKATSPIGTTYQIGALNSISQFAGNYPRTAIIAMPPKATLAEYQAWIEQELTLRGLI